MTTEPSPLSDAVLAGRQRIFAELLDVQRERIRRRRSRRAVLAGATLAVVVAILGVSQRPSSLASPRLERLAPYEVVERTTVGAIEIVNVPARPLVIEYMTDDDVVSELRAAGLNVGIARVGERVLIVGR